MTRSTTRPNEPASLKTAKPSTAKPTAVNPTAARTEGGKTEGKASNKDIAPLLSGWDYEPGTINVRKINGADGSPKLQMRLDLGLLQMEMTAGPMALGRMGLIRCWNISSRC